MSRKKGIPNKATTAWTDGHRECTECKRVLPFSMFHKHAQCLFGVNTVCKECRKPKSRQHWKDTDLRVKILNRTKSRATKYGIPFDITVEDIHIPTVCPVFGTSFVEGCIDTAASVDKIDPNKGYVSGNIQIISNKANRMKSNASTTELRAFAAWIISTDTREI